MVRRMDMASCFSALLAGRSLDERAAEWLFEEMLEGRVEAGPIGALLGLIASRGASVDELVGGARAMRRRVTPVAAPAAPAGLRQVVLDTCGTGGALKTFNISTAVAIVTAAASPHHRGGDLRVLVAKHGNRSRSGRGSAEVLAALGVNVDAGPETQAKCLEAAGVCFCFAVHHHPGMKFVGPARRTLPFPTIFNLLGPLTNPAGAPRQLLGVWDATYVAKLGEALVRLGSESAMVVHGAGGMDEVSTLGATTVCRVGGGRAEMGRIEPDGAGVGLARVEELCVDSVEGAAERVHGVLGGAKGACREIVLLNAAAALLVAGAAADLREAARIAAETIDSGRARGTLEALVRVSREQS
jgi:anthranilate phosphoribosyltransferase